MVDIFFHNWSSIGRVAMMAGLTYVLAVVALRVFGAQALAKMSGYDLIVTVAVGSLVANMALSADFAVADGVTALLTFLVLQEITRRLQKRSETVHHLVRERPRLVVWDGQFLKDRLDASHITADEVRAAVRRTGLLSMTQVQAVILENDGEWSVLPRSRTTDLSALHGLEIPGRGDVEGRETKTDAWPEPRAALADVRLSERKSEDGDGRDQPPKGRAGGPSPVSPSQGAV